MKTQQYLILFLTALLGGASEAIYLRRSAKTTHKNRRLMVRYLKAKAEKINPAFYQVLKSGQVQYEDKLDLVVPDAEFRHCRLQGKATYSISQLKGLDNLQSVILEPVKDSHDLWHLKTSYESFSADVAAQLSATLCGKSMDFTSYGTVDVEAAHVEAVIRIDADTRRPEVIDMVDVEQHRINYESNSSFRQLVKRVPAKVIEEGIDDFLHQLFSEQLEKVIESELTSSNINTSR